MLVVNGSASRHVPAAQAADRVAVRPRPGDRAVLRRRDRALRRDDQRGSDRQRPGRRRHVRPRRHLPTVTVNGDSGNDVFRIGQLFTAIAPVDDDQRGHPDRRLRAHHARLPSRGVSFPATINGGDGNDVFEVFRNVATLQLNGDNGDDTFIVRTFLLANDPAGSSDHTTVNTGEGRDLTQYVINAPVSIDGGSGYDTVIVVGTEEADTFVVTADGVYGAGRYVAFVNIERLMLETMEGDDRIYVQSTNPPVETYIFGGLGSDHIEVAAHARPWWPTTC